jgi:hypothetical protein
MASPVLCHRLRAGGRDWRGERREAAMSAKRTWSMLAVIGLALDLAPSAEAMVLCARGDRGRIGEGASVVVRSACRAREVALPFSVDETARVLDEVVPHGRSLVVGADRTETVESDVVEATGGDRAMAVGGSLDVAVGTDASLAVGRDASLSVGRDADLTVGGDLAVQVQDGAALAVGESLAVEAGKDVVVAAGRALRVEARDEIVLAVGPSKIVLRRDGITIDGPKIEVKAAGELKLKGAKIDQN